MKIGIFDPYLDSLGGGEKYILDIASSLIEKNSVFIFWDTKQEQAIKETVLNRFGSDLSSIHFTPNIFSSSYGKLKRYLQTRKYDVIFFLSDGSIPLLLSKKNILILQFPVNWVKGTNIVSKLKLKKISQIICYSEYVKKYLDKTFNVQSLLIPPAVKPIGEGLKKENIILSVGRFTKAMNTKKQEFLIETFKKICKTGLNDWKLVLVGSVFEKDYDYVEILRKNADGYPIEILANISYSQLKIYYQKAKIYWHAAGMGEDLEKNPERAEHFGISTVEAMSAGIVPIVINAGGQKEIVQDSINGMLWIDEKSLIQKTQEAISNHSLWESLSANALERAKMYSVENFKKRIFELIT